MSLTTDPVLSQKLEWNRDEVKQSTDAVIDRCTDGCGKAAKKVAHGLIDCCSDTMEFLE